MHLGPPQVKNTVHFHQQAWIPILTTPNIPVMIPKSHPWATNRRSPHRLLPIQMPTLSEVGGHWSPPTDLNSDQHDGFFGDQIRMKSSHHFHGISCQLGCLQIDPEDSKHERLACAISSFHADAIALQELGLNFSHCGIQGQWKSWMAYNKWFDAHSVKHALA